MKAITIWQPWASLIACGAKKYETRSWATNYRGPIAIHAARLNPIKLLADIPNEMLLEMNKVLFNRSVCKIDSEFCKLPRLTLWIVIRFTAEEPKVR